MALAGAVLLAGCATPPPSAPVVEAPVEAVPAKDEIVSTPAIAAYAKRLPGAEFVAIDDALHDLPQERDIHRSRMFEAVDAFFARHTHSMA